MRRRDTGALEEPPLQLEVSRSGANVKSREQSTFECLPRGEAYG